MIQNNFSHAPCIISDRPPSDGAEDGSNTEPDTTKSMRTLAEHPPGGLGQDAAGVLWGSSLWMREVDTKSVPWKDDDELEGGEEVKKGGPDPVDAPIVDGEDVVQDPEMSSEELATRLAQVCKCLCVRVCVFPCFMWV